MNTCTKPIPFETLTALWTGELSEAEAAAVEEHVFACDECSEAFDRFAKLAIGLRDFIPIVISHAHRARLVSEGTRICNTPVEAGHTARARFCDKVDLLVHELIADLSGVDSVDLELSSPDGKTRLLLERVPFDAEAGELLVACQRHYEGMFAGDPIMRVYAVQAGKRRHVGEYIVEHAWR